MQGLLLSQLFSKDGIKTLEKGGVKVVCADGKANHIVELKPGRSMQLEGHGEDKYKYQN